MLSNYYLQQSSSAFDFNMRTSSGDKIHLDAYKESQLELSHTKESNLETTSLSLRESYGYSFSYSGNGLDEQDKKEIDQALKKISPLLSFLNPKEAFNPTDKNISDKAMDINALLPKTEETNMTNYMKDTLVTMMDDMMKAFDANDKILTLAKEVFDALDKQMEGLRLYA